MIFSSSCDSIKVATSTVRKLLTKTEINKGELSKVELQAKDDSVSYLFASDDISYRVEIDGAEILHEGVILTDIEVVWDTLKPFTDRSVTLTFELDDDSEVLIGDGINSDEPFISEGVISEGIDLSRDLTQLNKVVVPRLPFLNQLNIAKKLQRKTFSEATTHINVKMCNGVSYVQSFNFTGLFEGQIEGLVVSHPIHFLLDKPSLSRVIRTLSSTKENDITLYFEEDTIILTAKHLYVELPAISDHEMIEVYSSLPYQDLGKTVYKEVVNGKEWGKDLKSRRKESPERLTITTKGGLKYGFSDEGVSDAFSYPFKNALNLSASFKDDISVGIGTRSNGFPLIVEKNTEREKIIIAMTGFEENVAPVSERNQAA